MKRATKQATKQKTKAIGTSKRRVLPLSPRLISQTVVTIGYRTASVVAVETLKEDYASLKERLGGKGAGLAAMAKLKVPVPPAFNLSTSLCGLYLSKSRLPDQVFALMKKALFGLEKSLDRKLGSSEKPLLLSVRSGARVSMPGMMDTILNLGLNSKITETLAAQDPERARFWWDCYRRLIQMFSDVVLGVEPEAFESALSATRTRERVQSDAEISVSGLHEVVKTFLAIVRQHGKDFPEDPWTQLSMATEAVFRSWNTDRAVAYRRIHGFSDEWGTAVTVQAMVFGNLNTESGTGVVFTRNPSTGEKEIYGEYLLNAQGEDVVAGIRTPHPIEELAEKMPKTYRTLLQTLQRLEDHFRDAQDVEFTIEDGRLFILQTRSAKRTASATVENAIQFVKEKKIGVEVALSRLTYDHVRQLLHPTLKANQKTALARGLPASPGAAAGRIAFDPDRALSMSRAGYKVILVRRETSPEDIMGMAVSEGILTATGGMTSHAAVVGRGMGKCCVVGCSDLQVDEKNELPK